MVPSVYPMTMFIRMQNREVLTLAKQGVAPKIRDYFRNWNQQYKSFFSKKCFTKIKSYAFNHIFLKEKNFQTHKTSFNHGKMTLKVKKCPNLMASRYPMLTNIKILSE